ncbi:MAG: hypothetical protein OES57_00215 [Acidimicrobiia bacterium]|nr:hypothetical protein [Acidimicrobiia bacterium]
MDDVTLCAELLGRLEVAEDDAARVEIATEMTLVACEHLDGLLTVADQTDWLYSMLWPAPLDAARVLPELVLATERDAFATAEQLIEAGMTSIPCQVTPGGLRPWFPGEEPLESVVGWHRLAVPDLGLVRDELRRLDEFDGDVQWALARLECFGHRALYCPPDSQFVIVADKPDGARGEPIILARSQAVANWPGADTGPVYLR